MKDAARWVARKPRDKTPFIGRMANQEGLDTPLPRKNSDLSPRNNRLVITAPSSSSCNRTTKYILSFNARFERCAANKSRYIAARNNPSLDEEERERWKRIEGKGKKIGEFIAMGKSKERRLTERGHPVAAINHPPKNAYPIP